VGRIEDPIQTLNDLFDVRADYFEWWRRVDSIRGKQFHEDCVREGFGRPNSFPAWQEALADPTVARIKERKFAHSLQSFLLEYGPLSESDCTDDTVRAIDDLHLWSQRQRDAVPQYNPETLGATEQLRLQRESVERINAALQSVYSRMDGIHQCPTLYAALALAVDWGLVAGIRFYVCADPDCFKTFVPRRSTAEYCSSTCRKRSNRRTRA
jgi:hypothetical protein